jgi:hypothetical protein
MGGGVIAGLIAVRGGPGDIPGGLTTLTPTTLAPTRETRLSGERLAVPSLGMAAPKASRDAAAALVRAEGDAGDRHGVGALESAGEVAAREPDEHVLMRGNGAEGVCMLPPAPCVTDRRTGEPVADRRCTSDTRTGPGAGAAVGAAIGAGTSCGCMAPVTDRRTGDCDAAAPDGN